MIIGFHVDGCLVEGVCPYSMLFCLYIDVMC